MSEFFSLLKTTLNVNYGFSVLKYQLKKDRKKLVQTIFIIIGVFVGLISISSVLGAVMVGIFLGGKSLGKPELVITIAFLMTQLVVLMFGIFYIMGTFYFANDMNILLPLPLKASHVLGTKLIIVMINEYLTVIPVLLPSLIIFGVGTGQGVAYYSKALFVLLASPVIPLVLCSLFVVALMRFVNLRRSKDLLAILGGFVGLGFAIGWNYFVQRMPKTGSMEFFQNFLASQTGLIESIGNKFPPSIWITYGLSKPGLAGLGYILLFFLVAALLLAVLMWIGNRWFYKSILAGQEVTRKRTRLSREDIGRKQMKEGSPLKALFRREWKVFFRTPVYVMNGIMGMVIAPILIAMPFLTQRNEMGEFMEVLRNPANSSFVTVGALGIVLYITNLNIIASTAISREGSMYWMSRMIPVSPREQITAKLLHSLMIEMLGIVASIAVLTYVLGLTTSSVIIMLVLSVIGNLLFVILNLIIDVLHPKLHWTNPQEAVKQNLNGFFGILVSTLITVLLAGITVGLIALGVKGWFLYVLLGLVMALLTLPCMGWLYAAAENMYQKVEA